ERTHPDWQLQLYTCVPIVKNGAFSQSEEAWADLAASGFRSSINKVRVSAEALPGEFASLICLHEEPFSSPVVFAQLQLFRVAHERSWPSHAPVRGPQFRRVLDIEPHAAPYSRAPGFRAVIARGVLGYSEPAHEIH